MNKHQRESLLDMTSDVERRHAIEAIYLYKSWRIGVVGIVCVVASFATCEAVDAQARHARLAVVESSCNEQTLEIERLEHALNREEREREEEQMEQQR